MNTPCVGCRSPRSESTCGLCQGAVCRKCRAFLSEDEFPFITERPPELRHTYYCGACHDEKVEPFRAEYEAAIEKAKGINIIYKGSKSTLRYVRKAKEPVRVSGSPDRDDVIMKLAFHAARENYNAVVDVEVSARKDRYEGWQKSAWQGHGTPAEISSHQLNY